MAKAKAMAEETPRLISESESESMASAGVMDIGAFSEDVRPYIFANPNAPSGTSWVRNIDNLLVLGDVT